MRHSLTERSGVYATASIITNDLKWIFREQPIVDIGIDALVEQVRDGNPTGKFMALQIKSGEGNFYFTDDKIIYYATQIHYNYWLNLNIPVLMIAHFPSDGSTYWQHINERNFKRTKKQWKLEIPRNQKLNEKSASQIAKILPLEYEDDVIRNLFEGKTTEEDAFDILEKVKSIYDATQAMLNIGTINDSITGYVIALTEKLDSYHAQGMSNKSIPVVAAFKSFSKQLIHSASRMEKETEIFADYYAEGVFAFEAAIIFLCENRFDFGDLDADFSSMLMLPETISGTIIQLNSLENTLQDVPIEYAGMKEARNFYLEVVRMLNRELDAAKRMTERLIKNLPSEML